MGKKFTQLFLVFVAAMLIVLATGSADVQASRKSMGIVSPNKTYRGKTYGEWAASWWKKFFDIPVVNGDHPYFSGGAFQGKNGVMYLAGVVAQPEPIDITIDADTPLFVPIINTECSVIEGDPYHGDDELELSDCANGHIDRTSGHFAELDGKPVKKLRKYRVELPLFEFGPLPEDNLLGVPAGSESLSVDAGYYLLIKPLAMGEHTLHFGATFDDFDASIDTTYHITVEP